MMFFCIAILATCVFSIEFPELEEQDEIRWLVGNEATGHENGFLDLIDPENDQFKYVY